MFNIELDTFNRGIKRGFWGCLNDKFHYQLCSGLKRRASLTRSSGIEFQGHKVTRTKRRWRKGTVSNGQENILLPRVRKYIYTYHFVFVLFWFCGTRSRRLTRFSRTVSLLRGGDFRTKSVRATVAGNAVRSFIERREMTSRLLR